MINTFSPCQILVLADILNEAHMHTHTRKKANSRVRTQACTGGQALSCRRLVRRAGGQAGRRAGGQAGRRGIRFLQAGRRAGGQAGRRAGGQAGRRAGGHGQAGRRAGGQAGRRAGGQARGLCKPPPIGTLRSLLTCP